MTVAPAPPSSSCHPLLTLLESNCTTIRDLRKLHANLTTTGLLARHPAAANRLLSSYASLDPAHALLLFHHYPHPHNRFTYDTTIRCLAQRHRSPHLALSLFLSMLQEEEEDRGVIPGRLTFPALFKACARLGRDGDGMQLHAFAVKLDFFPVDAYVRNAVLSMYASCGRVSEALRVYEHHSGDADVVATNTMILGFMRGGGIEDELVARARELFDGMSQRNVVTWSTMISGYVGKGRYQEAFDLFGKVREEGVEPNDCILVSMLGACGCIGAIEQGKWIHGFIERKGIELNPIVVTAIIDMYSKCSCVDEARRFFESLPERARPLSSWNSMISGLAMHGRGDEAVRLFERLRSSPYPGPDRISYLSVLTACNHTGMVAKGLAYFREMMTASHHGIEPTVEHYGCVVDMLGRAGLLDAAEELIRAMPVEPDAVIWGSLLAACRTHGDLEMGRRAAERVTVLDPEDSGGYVLLANACASAREVDGAVAVRVEIDERGVRRRPGCSMVEVDGVVHEFVANGALHSSSGEIRVLLDGLAGLKREGAGLLVESLSPMELSHLES